MPLPPTLPTFPAKPSPLESQTMSHKRLAPPTEAAIFEAGYLASTLRARREFTWAQRAAIVSVLTGATPDARVVARETPRSNLRSFALILARCESAASLLGWRKLITPVQKSRLDAAIRLLQEAAAQITVRASVQPIGRRPDMNVRFQRNSRLLKP